jgi:CMP-N,N'-diacetyllegionaminic acid synthase
MKIAALLTGKKNSSFKRKNEMKILNDYIFNYSAKEAKKVKKINFFYTSSDSKIILNQTKKIGFQSIYRPAILSKKNSKHIDVIKHALKIIKKDEKFPDIIVVLLANAPVIKSDWISACINKLIRNKDLSAVVPVLKFNDHHPYRAKKMQRGILQNFINKKQTSTNRQDLPGCFFLCHNFWVIRTNEIFKNNGLSPWTFMGKKVSGYKIKNSIDVHDPLDLEIAKILVRNDKYI